MKKSAILTLTAMLVGASAGFCQAPAAPPSFEVASIKPAPPMTAALMRSGQFHIGTTVNKARADFGGMTLLDLIARAYRVKSYQVSGPDFLNTERFDIVATLPEGASTEQVPEMLQGLLAERFKLKVRRGNKEFSVYALVEDKGGAKLTPRPDDYDPAKRGETGPLTMEAYASLLSSVTGRPVVDQTGLKGQYMVSMMDVMKVRMSQMKSEMEQRAAAGAGIGGTASDPSESQAFGIVKALGLKLESRKLPLPLIVVEHMEKTPTEN